MSQVNELLNNMTEEEFALYTADPETEPHIVVNIDRNIVVPSELKKIAVQFDHDVETVTFDCPRYWDGLDMSQMVVYINYKRPDGYLGSYIADNVRVSDADENIMNFEWTLSRNATPVKGNLSFLVCVKKTDENGEEVNHWNSELNREMVVSEGLECDPDIVEAYPDIITQLLIRMDTYEAEIKSDVSTFVVNVTINSDGTVTADKNGYEIIQAYNEGRNIIAVDRTDVYHLLSIYPEGSMGEVWFSRVNSTWQRQLCCMGDSWVYSDYTFATKTQIDNLNTQITNNSNRITTLETNMGDVETALNNIIAIQNSLMGVSK